MILLTEVVQINGYETLCFPVLIDPEVDKRLRERIELWSRGKPVEWACALIGRTVSKSGETLVTVEDFVDLVAYNVHRKHGIAISLEDLKRVAERYSVVGLLHTHAKNLEPSANDIAIALYAEMMSSNPLIHVIASSKEWLVFSFEKCWKCPNSFFSLLKSREDSRKVHRDERRRK